MAAKLPVQIFSFQSVTINNRLLIFGNTLFLAMTEPIRSISSGGYDGTPGGGKGESKLRNILEFDQEAEAWTEVGKMQEGRAEFAVSVVPYHDYAKWCK